jgi:hypothetical protein
MAMNAGRLPTNISARRKKGINAPCRLMETVEERERRAGPGMTGGGRLGFKHHRLPTLFCMEVALRAEAWMSPDDQRAPAIGLSFVSLGWWEGGFLTRWWLSLCVARPVSPLQRATGLPEDKPRSQRHEPL